MLKRLVRRIYWNARWIGLDLAQCRNAADVLRCLHRGITRPKGEPIFPAWEHWLQVPAAIREVAMVRLVFERATHDEIRRYLGEHGVDVAEILASSGAAVR
ncbi:MAG TPA: hypothetical protein GX715_07110 [Armatimonadetes bacterium]|nr:hypothetical protein [Armatimonadota bacterium]